MELIEVSKRIESKIKALEQGRSLLQEKASAKAVAISDYDRALAITLIKLREGMEMVFEGHKIKGKGIPANIIEKIAKGMCHAERLMLEEASASYSAVVSKMDSLKAELNGLQSINRHLSEI